MSDSNANAAPIATNTSLAQPRPRWQKNLWIAIAIVFLFVFVVRLFDFFTASGRLPGCESDAVKSALSNIFKQGNLEFSRYIEIKTVTTTDQEITCYAKLAKSAGGSAEFDYRVFFEDKVSRVAITRAVDLP